jgi:hypothetical protein
VFQIRIHLIRVEHFRLNSEFQIRIQGFDDVQATGEAFRGQKRTSSISKHEVPLLFNILWVIFTLLDPDLDPKSGSGSTDLIESGSVSERLLIGIRQSI